MKHAAVIVETRPLDGLNKHIYSHTNRLPKDWDLVCFCSEENQRFMPEGAKTILLPTSMSEYEYNKLLTSLWFWEQVQYDKVLIFQHDSEIFRDWDSKFEPFDYIGAPWKFQHHGGNGGLSWRSVEAMKWCVNQTQWFPYMGNEDVYFSNILQISGKYKLADRQTCSEFSCESIYQPNTFGGHAIDKYLTPDECNILRGIKSDWIQTRAEMPTKDCNVVLDMYGTETHGTYQLNGGFKVNGEKVYKISKYKYAD